MAKEDFQANWRGARRFQFDEETRRRQDAHSEWHPSPAEIGPWNAHQYSDRIAQFHPERPAVQEVHEALPGDTPPATPHRIRYTLLVAALMLLAFIAVAVS